MRVRRRADRLCRWGCYLRRRAHWRGNRRRGLATDSRLQRRGKLRRHRSADPESHLRKCVATPSASRTLTINLHDSLGASALAPASFTQISARPTQPMVWPWLIDPNLRSAISMAMATSISSSGRLTERCPQSINNGGVFGPLTLIGAVDLGDNSRPTLGDLDGDGDLDLVIGETLGRLFQSINTGTTAYPVFSHRRRFGALDADYFSNPALGDLDGDGDLDLVTGEWNGRLFTIVEFGHNSQSYFGPLTQIGTLDAGEQSTPNLAISTVTVISI